MSRKNIFFPRMLVLFILWDCAHGQAGNDVVDSCLSKLCITRCCPENKHIFRHKTHQLTCVTNQPGFPEEHPVVYTADFKPIPGSQVLFLPELNTNVSAMTTLTSDTVLMKNGSILVKSQNKVTVFTSSEYCMGHKFKKKASSYVVRYFTKPFDTKLHLPRESEKIFKVMDYFKIIAWLVSSVLLMLVLMVYALLKELRNLRGMVLMSYLASLLTAYALLAAYGILFTMGTYKNVPVQRACVLVTYYSIIACFCWMNVMSFDLWWTFRGMVLVRAINRRGELHKYLMYCTFAWVAPLVLTAAVVLLDEYPSQHTWIRPPNIRNGNAFNDKAVQLYIYMPILPLILANVVLFILTVTNIAHLNNGAPRLNRNINSQKNRFSLYLKLSVVMGLNWLLECLSPPLGLPKYYFADVYNGLIGVVIFFIFVKQKTWKQLVARYRGKIPRSSQLGDGGGSSGTDYFSNSCECAPLQSLQTVNCDPRAANATPDRQSSIRRCERPG